MELIVFVELWRFDLPFAPPNLLILLESLVSNPTLSAILFKINRLLRILNPLSEPLSSLELSDMQFCKAQVRAVKAKND